jgi:hypothetical protein
MSRRAKYVGVGEHEFELDSDLYPDSPVRDSTFLGVVLMFDQCANKRPNWGCSGCKHTIPCLKLFDYICWLSISGRLNRKEGHLAISRFMAMSSQKEDRYVKYRLADILRCRNLNIETLAIMTNIDCDRLLEIKDQTRIPSELTAWKIAKALKMAPDDIEELSDVNAKRLAKIRAKMESSPKIDFPK